MATVADLLQQSRAAHAQKKRAAGTIDAKAVPSGADYPLADAHLGEALTLRLAAHDLDPEHADPAWASDERANRGVSHDALVCSFRAYLSQQAPARAVLSIAEIHQAVDAPIESQAYALALLESGWITPADLPDELLKTGAFMRFVHQAETP